MLLHHGAWAAGISLIAFTAATAQPRPAPEPGGTLVFAVESEPSNYDCQANVSPSFLQAVAPHYSTLLKVDSAHYPAIVGDLAASWSVSQDQLTYTFKLRPDVLFHDGKPLTSSDVKATYLRIIKPPPGVISARQGNYTAIGTIETPDPLTVVFQLQRPDAAMVVNLASPWNCIYQSAKLDADPLFPTKHVLGTGPFAFTEHKKGESWTGRRWVHYFVPNQPYLDGYEADFISGTAVVKSMEAGRTMAGFRSFTPGERDELKEALGDKITVQESPWLLNQMLVFNAKQAPFDDARVRRALSLAIDRWEMAFQLSHTTVMKYVGGLMRPGFGMATPDATLSTLPGLSHDITASREEARRLLAEAGVSKLSITLVTRDLPGAYGPSADAVLNAWRAIGVTANEVRLNARDLHMAVESGHFEAAFDFDGDAVDDPSLQLQKYVSGSVSPSKHAMSSDRTLDKLYTDQATSSEPGRRADIVHEFERRALTEAYAVPILWWNRIVVTSATVKGWTLTPSLYVGQDLSGVWLDRQGATPTVASETATVAEPKATAEPTSPTPDRQKLAAGASASTAPGDIAATAERMEANKMR